MKVGLTLPFVADGAILPARFVKPGAAAGEVAQASSATDLIIGVSPLKITYADGDVCDAILTESPVLKLGGTVVFGDRLTSDSSGRGIAASGTVRVGAIALAAGVINDEIPVLLYPSNIEGIAGITASAAGINTLNGAPLDASFVIGTETSNVINVVIQLKDADGADLAVRGSLYAYLSDDANGDSLIATATSGTVVIGTDGLANVLEAKKQFRLTSESDGDIDLNITEAGVKTLYLILVLPNGKLKASGAITFA